ncbi:uncharacterized protein [Primulina eburnea]|uniref:uncharacterized protein isoform X2 n=1 Tax=Primulina eburnea TaxID=1245227 RepID=UPI003C6BEEA5
MATIAASSVMRLATASSRSPVIRISPGVKTKATTSPFGISSRTPLTARIFRTPVELSGVSLVSMLPYHTATASALLKSMLSVAPHGQDWTLEGKERIEYEVTRKRVVITAHWLTWDLEMDDVKMW